MTQKPVSVLICERFATEALIELKKSNILQVQSYREDLLSTAQALIIRSQFKINAELLHKATDLKLIVTATSGYDHIDLAETEKRNITVMYTPEANAMSAAELTWALVLSCCRQVSAGFREVKSGDWRRDSLISSEIHGKTLGLVGLGRIGQRVARIASAFDMPVLAFDPYQTDEAFKKSGAERVSYEEVLKQSDILSFHVPLTFETKNMFNRSQIEYVSPDLILVNTSRGGVINEEDLAQALLDKKIKCAGLDVFSKEPLPRDAKILKCPNVVLTPHLGAYTHEAFLKASLSAAHLVLNFFENHQTQNTLPLKNDWGKLSFAERT